MRCSKCQGQKFLYTTVSRKINEVYKEVEAVTPCDECGGQGYIKPKALTKEPAQVDPARANNPDGKDLRAVAEEWIVTHPHSCALLLKFAREMASRARAFGVKLLVERLRWECALEGWSDQDYRINNNLTAYLARWLIAQDPTLEKYVKFRETRW